LALITTDGNHSFSGELTGLAVASLPGQNAPAHPLV